MTPGMLARVVLAMFVWGMSWSAARAGLRYRFESSAGGKTLLDGTACVDGKRSRLDLRHGDGRLFPNRAIVLSSAGKPALLILDPSTKTYTELNLEQIASSLRELLDPATGALELRVLNPRVVVRDLGDAGTMQRFAVHRYAVQTSFELLAVIGTGAVKAKIHSNSQLWTTRQIAQELATFVQSQQIRTGLPELDAILDRQNGEVAGFPLKEVISTEIEWNGRKSRTTTMVLIDHLEQATFPDSLFALPSGYRKR